MDDIKKTIINECLNTLKRDDIQHELKNLMQPIVDMIISQLYPYIFLSIIFVSVGFLLILGTFILLLRYKYIFQNLKKI